MKKTKRLAKAARRPVTLLTRQLGDFADPKRRQKQQGQPRAAADKPSRVRIDQPRNAGHHQDCKTSEAPAAIQAAAPERLRQHDQRRNAGDEKQDVVEIDHELMMQRGN